MKKLLTKPIRKAGQQDWLCLAVLFQLFLCTQAGLAQTLEATRGILVNRDTRAVFNSIDVGANLGDNGDLAGTGLITVATLCPAAANVNDWLEFFTESGEESIQMRVKTGAVIPLMAGVNQTCTAASCTDIATVGLDPLDAMNDRSCTNGPNGAAFSSASRSQCHLIRIDAFGQTEEYFICVFGNPFHLTVDGQSNDENPDSADPTFDVGFDFDPVMGTEISRDLLFQARRGPEPSAATSFTWNVGDLASRAYVTFWGGFTSLSPSATNQVTTTSPNLTIRFAPQPTDLAGSPAFSVTVTEVGGENDTRNFRLVDTTPDRSCEKVEVVFVLDKSGSMTDPGNCTGDRKWDYMIEQFEPILQELANAGRENIRFGFVFFSSTATTLPAYTGMTSLNGADENAIRNNVRSLIDEIKSSVEVTGSTSIGAGINMANAMFSPDWADQKFIVVLTNGMQNTPPFIEEEGARVFIDNNENGAYNASELVLNAIPETQVKIVYFYEEDNSYRDLIERVNGDAHDVLSICRGVNIIEGLGIGTLACNSPKISFNQSGNFSGNRISHSFTVNQERLGNIIIGLRSSGNHSLDQFSVQKNGAPLSGNIVPPLVTPSNYRIFVARSTLSDPDPLKGNYTVTAGSTAPGVPYNMLVTVDDRQFAHRSYTGAINYRAGQSLQLATALTLDHNPLDGNRVQRVTATIYRPRNSFGKVSAKTRIPGQYWEVTRPRKSGWDNFPEFYRALLSGLGDQDKAVGIVNTGATARDVKYDFPSNARWIKFINIKKPANLYFEDNITMSQKKYQVAYVETDLLKKLEDWSTVSIPLTFVKDGIWRGNFEDTKISGLYPVRFKIEGQSPDNFVREDFKEAFFDLGTLSFSKSNINVWDENVFILELKPRDVYGNYLGPGNADEIRVQTASGGAGGAVDYLNGKYVVRLINTPLKNNPELKIWIKDELVYRDRLSKLMRDLRFNLQAVYLVPQSNLSNDFDPGVGGEAALSIRLYKNLFLKAEGGYYPFKAISNSEPDLKLYGGGLGLQYGIPLGFGSGWNFFLDALTGGFKQDGGDLEFGFNAGAGIGITLAPNVVFVMQGKYYQIKTQPADSEFAGLLAGLRFSF